MLMDNREKNLCMNMMNSCKYFQAFWVEQRDHSCGINAMFNQSLINVKKNQMIFFAHIETKKFRCYATLEKKN